MFGITKMRFSTRYYIITFDESKPEYIHLKAWHELHNRGITGEMDLKIKHDPDFAYKAQKMQLKVKDGIEGLFREFCRDDFSRNMAERYINKVAIVRNTFHLDSIEK